MTKSGIGSKKQISKCVLKINSEGYNLKFVSNFDITHFVSNGLKRIHLDKNWGVFIGSFEDNKLHRHYAIQLSIGIDKNVKVIDAEAREYVAEHLIIQDHVLHRLECKGNHILILFNPFSRLGHYIQNQMNVSIGPLELNWISQIKDSAKKYLEGTMSFDALINDLLITWSKIDCLCDHVYHITDVRIAKALSYIEDHEDRIIPVNEIAEGVNLSVDRFLHLFKSTTGMSYRRAQLWNKTQRSLSDLRIHSITETAYRHGFSDSAHYTRTFKENFGFSPKFISKI